MVSLSLFWTQLAWRQETLLIRVSFHAGSSQPVSMIDRWVDTLHCNDECSAMVTPTKIPPDAHSHLSPFVFFCITLILKGQYINTSLGDYICHYHHSSWFSVPLSVSAHPTHRSPQSSWVSLFSSVISDQQPAECNHDTHPVAVIVVSTLLVRWPSSHSLPDCTARLQSTSSSYSSSVDSLFLSLQMHGFAVARCRFSTADIKVTVMHF